MKEALTDEVGNNWWSDMITSSMKHRNITVSAFNINNLFCRQVHRLLKMKEYFIVLLQTSVMVLLTLYTATCVPLEMSKNTNVFTNRSSSSNVTGASTNLSYTVNRINPYNYSFILQATPCTSKDELLMVVHSSPKVIYSVSLSIRASQLVRKNWFDWGDRYLSSKGYAGMADKSDVELLRCSEHNEEVRWLP